MQDEFEYALMKETLWTHHLGKFDRGSYCESPDNNYVAAEKIRTLYRQLADALLQYSRDGRKFPTVGL